jgi:hypothetical protein
VFSMSDAPLTDEPRSVNSYEQAVDHLVLYIARGDILPSSLPAVYALLSNIYWRSLNSVRFDVRTAAASLGVEVQ